MDYIVNHECSKTVPSLFFRERSDETTNSKVRYGSCHPRRDWCKTQGTPSGITAVISDDMNMIHRLSFEKEEYYSEIANRDKKHLITVSHKY